MVGGLLRKITPLKIRNESGGTALMHGAGCLRDLLHCVTCSDEAIHGRVLRVGPRGIASVQFETAIEEVSVELIEAAPGDIVLVHAGVAIARLGNEEASSGQE